MGFLVMIMQMDDEASLSGTRRQWVWTCRVAETPAGIGSVT